MRYFKYKNTRKNMNNALKEQYLTLTKDEQRTVRKEKLWGELNFTLRVKRAKLTVNEVNNFTFAKQKLH